MSQYKVINKFKDKDGHVYEIGDTYPADGKKFNETRAEFLTTIHPTYKMAFLEKIEDENVEKTQKNSEKTVKSGRKTAKNTDKNAENSRNSARETSES